MTALVHYLYKVTPTGRGLCINHVSVLQHPHCSLPEQQIMTPQSLSLASVSRTSGSRIERFHHRLFEPEGRSAKMPATLFRSHADVIGIEEWPISLCPRWHEPHSIEARQSGRSRKESARAKGARLVRSADRRSHASPRASPMKDYQAHLEKLRKDAAECRLISDLATSQAKRELFDRLARHLSSLADQLEQAMGKAKP